VRETVRKEPLVQVKLELLDAMDFEEIPKPPEHVVRYAMGLVSGPCIAMIILGFAVRVSEPPVLFVASMQHLPRAGHARRAH